MKRDISSKFKFCIGLAFSVFFLYLAFRQVDIQKLTEALRNSNIPILILAVLIMFISHWFRALRHRYLLEPVKPITNSSLFTALVIGYMANAVLPAHLGEFLRAYVIGKKEGISGSSAFATIVVERVLDVLSLLIIMGIVFWVYPFPKIIQLSAFITLAFTLAIIAFLVLLKLRPAIALYSLEVIARPFPKKIKDRLLELLDSFRNGVVGLKDRNSYLNAFILSVLIWVCYAGVFLAGFYAFDFIALYNLPAGASFVVLVIVTISIVVPSSPGYVGTYHWLCMIALGLFGIPESPALGYAIAIHAISVIPVALVGVIFAMREGIRISEVRKAY